MIVATGQDDEQRRRQRTRSLAIGLALGALVILFYVATIVRLGPNALRKDGVSRTIPTQPAATAAQPSQPAAPAADCKKAGTC
jgi:hypothetical protein